MTNTNHAEFILITGATSGIGIEFAKIMVVKNHNLILVGRNEEKLKLVKSELASLSQNKITIVTLCIDLSRSDAANFIYDQCIAQGLHVTILINNAGIGCFGEHVLINEKKIREVINVNITTLTLLCSLFGKHMKEKRAGYILNVASLGAYQPVPNIACYAASKSYVLNFSEALAKELEEDGVTVTCLSPGHTATNFFTSAGIGNREEGFYGLKTRISPATVAAIGINALFAKKLSVIPGFKNNFLASLNRFVSRAMTAKISKMLTKNA